MDLLNFDSTHVSIANHRWITAMREQGFNVKFIDTKPFAVILWKGIRVECMGVSHFSLENAATQCRQRSGWKSLATKPAFAHFHLN